MCIVHALYIYLLYMINVEQPHLIKFDDKGLISSATDASATDARTSTKPSSKNGMCLEYVSLDFTLCF